MNQAIQERELPVIEVHVDPFELPMPPKVRRGFVKEVTASLARGQSYTRRTSITLFRHQVHNILRNMRINLGNNFEGC